MKTELAPCPFCGSTDYLVVRRSNTTRVCCTKCCAGPPRFTEDRAVDAWNTRVSSLPAVSLDADGREFRFGESAVK